MRLECHDRIAEPGKQINEDLFDHNDQAAWIFDGASGIGPKTIFGASSDPHWLVHTFNAEFKANWDRANPTSVLFRAAAESTIRRYEECVQQPPPQITDRPTACLSMVRLWDEKLEISQAGDCWCVHEHAGVVADFGDKFDHAAKPVRDELKRLKAAGVPQSEILDRLLPLEREFRAKANRDHGYVIVDTSTRWIDRLVTRTVAVSPDDTILLMTDGMYRLIDVFGRYDAASLLQAARRDGLSALYRELREAETEDENCLAYPRAKVRDDVAAALLAITP